MDSVDCVDFEILKTKILKEMKKIFFIAAIVFVIALAFQSCKSVQDCPAYSNSTVEQPADNA